MDYDKNEIEIDPDYEGNNAAIRNAELKEEQESELTHEKLSKILQEQFDKELVDRQQQIEEIEDRIFRAQKLLHVVRFVLISKYYSNKALEYNAQEEDFQTTNILAGQNRIHPAIKKLLGKNATNLPILSSRTKRKGDSKHEPPDTISSPQEPVSKKSKMSHIELDGKSLLTNHIKPENLATASATNSESLSTNRLKTEHRIVVGNISYSKKSLEQDHLMHKWMVYIKVFKGATKNGPDFAANMMQKVIFYLHPSYKPHDVVEISNPPFHLSRRGWGEFPVRVQIFFKSDLNKPVDIIHNLKLDQTFMGRQTIGNETVVPIFLHDYDHINHRSQPSETIVNTTKVKLNSDHQTIVINGVESVSGFEHNYCHENIKTEIQETEEHDYCFEENSILSTDVKLEPENDVEVEFDINHFPKLKHQNGERSSLLDHSYSLPSGVEKTNKASNKSPLDDQPQTKLIYGLGDSYLDVNENIKNTSKMKEVLTDKQIVQTLVTATGQQIRFLPQSFSKVLLSNGNVVHVKVLRRPQSVLKKVDQSQIVKSKTTPVLRSNSNFVSERKIDRGKHKLRLPNHGFKNVGEVLPYLFKRIPLWNALAKDLDFKCTYPFVASSFEEYQQWNIGKKLSAEWSRAKTIKNLLRSAKFCDYVQWNTKAIFMYGRSHCYTPLVKSYKIFQNKSSEKKVLLNAFSSQGKINQNKGIIEHNSQDIDIVSEGDSTSTDTSNVIDISDKSLKYECTFVKESALDCGIILKPEPLVEGVTTNAAERMILEAVKCFSEGLIRRAQHHLVSQEGFVEGKSEITVKEVKAALNERPEFRTITDFTRKRSEIDYFFMS